ncbi:hypothetical protein SpCBS45565_g05465 [Spizellomyces sp. 'palustris']|nr:hypothetical protein SpCBS45565_g05465 [Spizellomyces sp. 'palustris']
MATAILDSALILDACQYAIFGSNCHTGVIHTFNRAAECLTGFDSSEVIGILSPLHFLDPADVQAYKTVLSQAQRCGVAQELAATYIRKDSSRVPVKLSVNCVGASRSRDAPIVGFVAVAVDMSEQKRMEKQMRELSTAMENAVEGIARVDVKGHYTLVNKAYAATLLYDPEELIGKSWESTLYRDSEEKVSEAYRGMIKEGRGVAEVRAVRRDGQTFYKEVTLVPCYDDDKGEMVGHYCFMRDITDRKTQEESLRISQLRLQEAQAIAHLGSWEYNVATGSISWSDELCRIFGIEPTERSGSKDFGMEEYMQLLVDEDRPLILSFIDQCVQTGTPYEVDHRIRRADGHVRVLCGRGRGIMDAEGRLTKLIGTAQDVTQQKQTERELIAAKEEALEASRHKSAFLRNMSHEVRTPINGITGMTSLLLQTNLTPEQAEYANGIRASASVLLTVVNDILDFSKVEAGKIELERIPFTIAEVVADVARMTSCVAEPKGLALEVEVTDEGQTLVIGDPNRLSQILINLTNNAIKFTERGKVTIRVRRISALRKPLSRAASEVGDSLDGTDISHSDDNQREAHPSTIPFLFEVIDTGIGISPEAQKRLFVPFSQADSSTTRKFGGTGLGLSICKSFVTLMNGLIDVDSTEGHGSRFYFMVEFLVVESKHPNPPPNGCVTAASHSPFTSNSTLADGAGATEALTSEDKSALRILVVEDNDMNRLICAKMLQKLGYAQITLAVNGKECIDLIKAVSAERSSSNSSSHSNMSAFDVVLMDCQMPIMDGFEATREIRAKHLLDDYVPIIALTANALEGDRERCLESGMDFFLTKPVVMEDLNIMVQVSV